VHGPAVGDLLAAVAGQVDLSACHCGVGDVDGHDTACGGGGCGDGPGVGAQDFGAATPRRHGWAGVGGQDGDTAVLSGAAGERPCGAPVGPGGDPATRPPLVVGGG